MTTGLKRHRAAGWLALLAAITLIFQLAVSPATADGTSPVPPTQGIDTTGTNALPPDTTTTTSSESVTATPSLLDIIVFLLPVL
ncbi:MAG: hypothetical protein AB1644_13600 [Candidatus Zixiibacteriota bacterium]